MGLTTGRSTRWSRRRTGSQPASADRSVDGVLAASADVLSALLARDRELRQSFVDAAFEQALTIVYRMLFLLFAEARRLVPLWHPVYRDSYSVEALRDTRRAVRARAGLWDALRAIARLAHAGCRAGDLRVTPFNGRLFAPARTPLAERRDLDDEAARARGAGAVDAPGAGSGRPRADRVPRPRRRSSSARSTRRCSTTSRGSNGGLRGPCAALPIVVSKRGSGVRKATGTFYTPQPIADYLVRRTLGPLVRDASAASGFSSCASLDPAMGSGAFLVAACRYLADAYEARARRAGGCHAERHRRQSSARPSGSTIAERCLYGVDLNPMAVQLARLSLWLATLAADRPLTFLDHHLVTGDSLLGAWLAHLRRPPPTPTTTPRRRRSRCSTTEIADGALKGALPLRFSLEYDAERHARAGARQGAGAAALDRRPRRCRVEARRRPVVRAVVREWRADTRCRACVRALADDVLAGSGALPTASVAEYLRRADDAARAHRFFHWELEFPEVFFDADGATAARAGFDAVIGNPPWDMMRADARLAPSRASTIVEPRVDVRFTRDAGVYTAQSDGHANRYQLFLERALALTRPGGRIGLVLPVGPGHRPRQRRASPSAALRVATSTRSSASTTSGGLSDPSQRPVPAADGDGGRADPPPRLPLRRGDPARARDDRGRARAHRRFPSSFRRMTLERLSGDGLAIPDLRSPERPRHRRASGGAVSLRSAANVAGGPASAAS